MISKKEFQELRRKSKNDMEAYDEFLDAKDELERCEDTCRRFMREAQREGHYSLWRHWKERLEEYESYWK